MGDWWSPYHFKKKNRWGRNPKFQLWAFGLYSRELKLAIIYLMPNWKKITLLPIIEKFIDEGSTIYSDELKTYVNTSLNPRTSIIEKELPDKHYTYLLVNHKYSFFNKYDNNIHTNSIKSSWKNLRSWQEESSRLKL